MEVKLFYKTQIELAHIINTVIDNYWNNEIKEDELIEGILKMYSNNSTKMIKYNKFTKILQQQCGKRRLEIVRKILITERKVNFIEEM